MTMWRVLCTVLSNSTMRRPRLITLLFGATLTLSAACNRTPPEGQQPALGHAPVPPATFAQAQPDDGQWVMAAKDYANTRYSGLQEITTDNIKRLALTWTFSTGV